VAIDLAAVVLLSLAAAAGALQGALHQLVHLAATAAGWAAAWLLAAPVGIGLERWLAPHAARGAAGLLLFVGFSALASFAGHRFLSARGVKAAAKSPANRGAGALLGGAKAGLALWVALSALALAGGRVSLGRFAVDGAGSDLFAVAREHNLISSLRPEGRRALERLGVEPGKPAPAPPAAVPGGGARAR
jgi:membrane protein required for colicin V production